MLYLPNSKIVDSSEVAVAPGVTIAAEGAVLVRVNTAQSNGVQLSAGTSADVFAGFSIAGTSAAPFPEGYASKVERAIVSAGGTVTLSQTPVTGQYFVFDNGTGAAAAGTITLTGKVVGGLTAGSDVSITYKHALSVVQARAIMGDTQPGGYVGGYVNQIGCAKRGVIYTDQFDAAVNWAAATGIKMKAGGILTDHTGGGVAIPGMIIATPGVDSPYLGIEFSAN